MKQRLVKQREGVVLLLALLCILALEVSAVGLHYATLQELRTARSARRDTSMRLAARSAVARVFATWPADIVGNLPLHAVADVPGAATTTADGISATAGIERIGADVLLIRGSATSRLGESVRIGALAATADPRALTAGFSAAVRTEGAVTLHPGARITDAGNACPTAKPSSALRMAAGALLTNAGSITGRITRDSSSTGIDRIGAVDRNTVAAIAAQPDSSAVPLRYAARDSVIDTLAGSGVLVVTGNVEIRGGTFDGVIMVFGSATISGGTRLNGSLIIAGGSLDLDNATVSFDACAISASLANPRFLGPFRPRGRMWIPLF
jgi:hypothetical protein